MNKKFVLGLTISAVAVILLVLFALPNLSHNQSKLPLSFIPSCTTFNNCTESACPTGSYFNSSLGYCYWNQSTNCPAGAIYQNNSNCKAEIIQPQIATTSICTSGNQNCGGGATTTIDACVAGYTYDKQNGICEPLPEYCKTGFSLYQYNGKEECVSDNACLNGYNLVFNNSINGFICLRQS
jgi:hypothetical protein